MFISMDLVNNIEAGITHFEDSALTRENLYATFTVSDEINSVLFFTERGVDVVEQFIAMLRKATTELEEQLAASLEKIDKGG